jgi:carboxymethylenebutenolidase
MSMTTRYESIAVDGDHFDAFCALPAGNRGPGILLFQEIFGINDNMRGIAARLADEGYVVVVPDMFWRIERRFERNDEAGLADAFVIVGGFDAVTALGDLNAAHAHLVGMQECTGRVGALGFCLGGGLAFATAATSRVGGRGIDAAVCYYGSAINGMLDQVPEIDCPVMFHYGEKDDFISAQQIAEVETAVAGLPGVCFHRYAAGHAFSNEDAPSMYDASAAAEAWPRTLDFLAGHLKG